MSHNWWHKDDGMTSQEAVAETRANVREEARQPSRPVPASAPSRPDPHGGFNVPDPKPKPSKPEPVFIDDQGALFGIGYHPGQVDPGLAIASIGKDFHESYTPKDIHEKMTGGFDVTYPGPSQPDAGITLSLIHI